LAFPWALPLALALALAFACTPRAEPAADEDTPAARIGADAITVTELDERIKEQLFQRASEGGNPAKLYDLRREALDNLIGERLLEATAAERGTSTGQLLEEAAAQAAVVSDEEVAAFFEANKSRMGERGLEEVRERIRKGLAQRGRAEEQVRFVAGLREEADVEVFLVRPRIAVEPLGPSRGPDDAPVTIVEFSDYQCPYCKRAETVVRALLDRFPEQVRYVYRHFPLDSIHPDARGASEAAVCAEAQGRFWEYHDVLFEKAPAFASEQLVSYAAEIGLDMDAFEGCIEDEATRGRVQQDFAAGQQAGVNGTPAFFVNGISLAGSRPIDAFVELIQSELAAQEDAS
jgi:predicted DsbA family dithiol-disulfide isomerase